MKTIVEKTARPHRYTDTHAFCDMVRRMLKTAANRIADGDAEDLRELTDMRDNFDNLIGTAVKGLREDGFTWASIGEALGTTGQAACMRYRRYCDG